MKSHMELNWWQLTAVQAGGIICLPVILIGHLLGKTYGWKSAIFAITFGNLFLFLISLITSTAGIRWRKSTAEFSIEIFGMQGKNLFAAAMVLSMVGWFSIQTSVITDSVSGYLFPTLPDGTMKYAKTCLNCLIGLAITLSSIKGMKSLTFVANLSLPALILTLIYALWRASENDPAVETSPSLNFSGTSVVVAAAAAAVIDLPTFFREGKSMKDGIAASFLTFAVLLPLLEFVGIYLYFHFEGDNIVDTLTGTSPSPLLQIWTVLFLLLAGWTTNNANLFSAAVSAHPLFPHSGERERLICLGGAASILSCMPILDNMEIFLNLLGIVLGSMGSVMIIAFFFKWKEEKDAVKHIANFSSWAVGALAGLVFYFYKPLISGIPFLDAFIVAGAMRIVLEGRKLFRTWSTVLLGLEKITASAPLERNLNAEALRQRGKEEISL